MNNDNVYMCISVIVVIEPISINI